MDNNPYRNNKNDKKTRLYIFSFVGILALVCSFIVLKPYILVEKNEPVVKVEEKTPYTFKENMRKNYYIYFPSNLKDEDFNHTKNHLKVEKDGFKFEYVQNLTIDKQELELYTFNPLQFYAFQMDSLIKPSEKIKDFNSYINIDEFYNKKYTFYALGFDEDSKYKYVVFNTYKDQDGKRKLSYAYIEIPKDNSNIYNSEEEINKEYHQELLKYMFSGFQHLK